MAEKVPKNYAIMRSIEETKHIVEDAMGDYENTKRCFYNDTKNTFYIEFDSFFSHKEGEIVLSPTKNGTNIFVNFEDNKTHKEIISMISDCLD